MQQYLQNKKGLVEGVFDQVNNRYDLMNDFMSLGIHRLWKNSLISMMSPSVNKKLVDVACGTGDISKLFLDKTNEKSDVTSIDPNNKMISQGKNKLSKYKNIEWINAPAEKLPLNDNSFDYYTISFGLRNTKNLDQALSEAYRVLKPGGRYLCLEFSKVQNTNLNLIYKNYSKLIPIIGQFIVGEKEPYEYLVKSIEQFINQEELIELMKKHKFQKNSYRNFSNGIVSIHSGWKI
ncbi:bifunctional demethylmenaquinone methyltransferase/2-methoxy-6-polyprenyl-1,4-benzoquinol methylase UbiE [Candidatus Pelagibacter sp.]|nr:bifunctional demethylmenaquinone methyltransferase/2-methoxy-6-polyprenyl-1,4-benzoquinol methylase UbiE [Candidatus Pelagibacter sp.]